MRAEPARPLRLASRAMATRFELVLCGGDEQRLRAAGQEALREIEECESRLSLFRRDSLVSHLARCAGSRWVRLDEDTFGLLELCARVHRESDGAFDPTVAPLMRAHGLHAPPFAEPVELDQALRRCGWDGVELDRAGRRARLARPGAALDLGGVAKGHALDLAARALREAGVESALLHGGTSTVLALAPPPGHQAWTVALGAGGDAPRAELAWRALSVSALDGRRSACGVSHVIDPRSGRGAEGRARVAVVLPAAAGCAALADAWSTALLAGGSAPSTAQAPGLELLVADDDRPPATWRALTPTTAFCLPPPRSIPA